MNIQRSTQDSVALLRRIRNWSFGALAGLLCATPASAALLVYEGFNYSSTVTASTPDGDADGHPDLKGLSGGSGFLSSSAWQESTFFQNKPPDYDYIQGGSLSFGNLITSGNSLRINQSHQSFSELTRSFNPIAATDGTTIWASVLLRPNNSLPGDTGSIFSVALFSSMDASGIEFGAINNSLYYGLSGLFGPQDSTVSHDNNNTVLLVLRIDFLPGDDRFSLYVNPTPGQPLSAVADVVTDDVTLTNIGSFDLYSMGQPANLWEVDELKIGTTYADIATLPLTPQPEPTSVALLGLSALLLGGQRRRS